MAKLKIGQKIRIKDIPSVYSRARGIIAEVVDVKENDRNWFRARVIENPNGFRHEHIQSSFSENLIEILDEFKNEDDEVING